MSPSYRAPFPTAFLSLNTPTHKSSGNNVASPSAEAAPHSFLSNRSAVPRHSSVSSDTSTDSTGSSPSPPAAKVADSPVLEPKAPAFLTLNSKSAARPTPAKEMSGEKSGFLSNKA